MKIRSKFLLIIATLIVCVILILVLSIYEIEETSSIQSTIIDGHKLITDFEISLGLVAGLTTAPDLIKAKNIWVESITNYSASLSAFTKSKNLKRMLSDKEFKFKYDLLLKTSDSALRKFLVIKNQLNSMESEGVLKSMDLSDPDLLEKNKELYYTYYEIKELRNFLSLRVRGSIKSLVNSLQEKSALLQQQRRSISLALILSLCACAIIFSLITLGGIAKNIVMVSRFMTNIARGDFKEKIQIESADEFGELSRSSTRLIDDLKNNVEKILQFTKLVSQQIIKGTGFSNILENIIQRIVECVNADGAALYLLNEKKDGLVINSIVGTYYPPDLINSYELNEISQADSKALFLNREIPVHNSISGTVAQTNDAVFIKDTETDELPRQLSGNIRELAFSVILVPLTVLEQTQGVLSVIRLKRNGVFADLDFIHIKSFADYAGLAIDNYNKLKVQSEKNRLQKEMEIRGVYEKELESRNKELEQFAYVASHDLQEPLRMVASYLKLIEKRYKEKLDKDGHEFIDFAVDGAKRMQVLIQDLLSYSRVGSKGKPFEITECEAVYEKAIKNLEISIAEHKAKLTHDVLPQVMADEGQLVQLFQNLIGNALKFCKDRIPEVHVSAKQDDKNKKWVFGIHDNGIGIAPEHQEQIFQIFQRLHGREEYEGTGIGLAVCKKIVERHGGKIWIESEVGKGTTFWFTIPVIGQHIESHQP